MCECERECACDSKCGRRRLQNNEPETPCRVTHNVVAAFTSVLIELHISERVLSGTYAARRVTRPVRPTQEELARNQRAKSSLHVLEKVLRSDGAAHAAAAVEVAVK